MPSGRNAELPDLSDRLFGSDVGFLSPFIYETLRELCRKRRLCMSVDLLVSSAQLTE